VNQYTSQSVVYGRTFMNGLLKTMKTVPGAALLATGKLRLSKDPSFAPTPATTLAELEANECDFSGYPAGGIAVSLTTDLNETPQIQGILTRGVFAATTATPFVPGSALGYWIDDGTDMAIGERFADEGTASFANVGDFLVLNAVLPGRMLQSLVA
jgi:hypothetical protein